MLHAANREGKPRAAISGRCRSSRRRGSIQTVHRLRLKQDYTEGEKWCRKAAEQDDPKAQYSLGFLYFHGGDLAQNYTEAANWLHKAAEQGYADAQGLLGGLYELGRGVPHDEAEALKWFHKAADQGNAAAEDFLGLHYAESDPAEAAQWFRKAADQGNADARSRLKKLNALASDNRQQQAEQNPIDYSQQTSEADAKPSNISQPHHHLTNDLASILALAVMGLVLFAVWPKQRSKASTAPVLASRARPAALATVTEDEFKDYVGTNAWI